MLYFQIKDQENVTRWPKEILQSHIFSPFHCHVFLEQKQIRHKHEILSYSHALSSPFPIGVHSALYKQ